MKTIFITSFHTLISRNILQTELLALLVSNYSVVLLTPDYKKDFFVKNFGGKNILVEAVPTELKRSDLWMRKLSLFLSSTKTLSIKKRADFFAAKTLFSFLALLSPSYVFGRLPLVHSIFRSLSERLTAPEPFAKLLAIHKPALVFSTDIQNELDVRLLHAARRAGVKTIGMVRSWDNLTAKGAMRVLPDLLAVNNEIVKKEAINLNGFPVERIVVTGIPHYDRYWRAQGGYEPGLTHDRGAFFRHFGFDPKKKFIFFAPAGRRYLGRVKTDKYALELLSALDVNILVRIPPGDSCDFEGWNSKKAKVVFDYSGVNFWQGGRKTNELSREDDDRLIRSLYFADAVAAHLATICIDAAYFDKPIVVIGFDVEQRPYWDSIRRYFDYDHLQPIIQSGGLKIASNPGELIASVEAYFKNPKSDEAGRRRIVEAEVQFSDGQATARLADILRG